MLNIFIKLYPEKKINFRHEIKEAFVFSSLEDLEEVIGNLIENACKFGKRT